MQPAPIHSTIKRSGMPALLAVLLCSALCRAQERPLRTDDATFLPVGKIRLQMGFEFYQGQQYTLSGLNGDLTRLGMLDAHIGVGEYAQFQVSGVVQDFLSVTSRSEAVIPPNFVGNATSDFGDLVLATKLKLVSESGRRPAAAFKFAVQLPNASNESGLGSDVTHFFASLLLSKDIGPARLIANVGLAILGSAVEPNSQADKLAYGVGVTLRVHPRVRLVAEISGQEGPERIGNENRMQARGGLQFLSGALRWDVAGVAGLKRFDPDTGLCIGVTYEFQAFKRSRQPKTIK